MASGIKKVQAKISTNLLRHVEDQKDYRSMNSYIKKALIKVSKYKEKDLV